MSETQAGPPKGVFVVGMAYSGLTAVAGQLHLLGLRSPVPLIGSDDASDPQDDLQRFNDELLAELGATWTTPKLLPRPELLRLLRHREGEARMRFTEALTSGTTEEPGGDGAWVWADARNAILAPFWIEALGVPASMVLVHRHPADVASALAAGTGIDLKEGFVLWDEYNRSALSLWEDYSGIIIGLERYRSDVVAGASYLQKYLESLGIVSSQSRIDAAVSSFPDVKTEPVPPVEVPNKCIVLDRVLNQAGFTTTVDLDSMVNELAAYYDEDYYTFYGNEGDAPYRYGEPQWDSFFGGVADRIAEDLKPASVLDAGCAIGFLVVALRDRGVPAWGVDVSEWAISQVPDRVKAFCSVASLTDELEGHFELVTIIEVIEHLPDAVSGPVIANLTRHADAVLFSSTPDGFEEATHVNVRTPDHWAGLFAANGFFRDFDYDASYLSPDAVLFRRGTLDTGEAIVGYERYLWESRTKAQNILAGFVADRTELVGLIDEYGDRCRTLEQRNATLAKDIHDVNAAMGETERRSKAAALEHQAALLDKDRQLAAVSSELRQATELAREMTARVEAVEGTILFRLSAGPRRFSEKVRRLGRRGA